MQPEKHDDAVHRCGQTTESVKQRHQLPTKEAAALAAPRLAKCEAGAHGGAATARNKRTQCRPASRSASDTGAEKALANPSQATAQLAEARAVV